MGFIVDCKPDLRRRTMPHRCPSTIASAQYLSNQLQSTISIKRGKSRTVNLKFLRLSRTVYPSYSRESSTHLPLSSSCRPRPSPPRLPPPTSWKSVAPLPLRLQVNISYPYYMRHFTPIIPFTDTTMSIRPLTLFLLVSPTHPSNSPFLWFIVQENILVSFLWQLGPS